jgi:hypothetical protein
VIEGALAQLKTADKDLMKTMMTILKDTIKVAIFMEESMWERTQQLNLFKK